jgi:predicted flap endonuclease-1-like 5' DNA nuclease
MKNVSLKQVVGLSDAQRGQLAVAGVHDGAGLLSAMATSKGASALVKASGLSAATLREAAHRADLMQVGGIGGKTADLFEDAGVVSVKQLSHRSAASLHAELARYAAANVDAHWLVPSEAAIAKEIAAAKALNAPPTPPPAPGPITTDQARPIAGAALNRYIDAVLFSDDPEGAAFRSNVLDGHTPEEQEAIRAQLHGSVGAFLGDGSSAPYSDSEGVIEQADSYVFTGQLDGLHTEVTVGKDGKPGNILVEID